MILVILHFKNDILLDKRRNRIDGEKKYKKVGQALSSRSMYTSLQLSISLPCSTMLYSQEQCMLLTKEMVEK